MPDVEEGFGLNKNITPQEVYFYSFAFKDVEGH
jgi:hypothetical protein